jgi:homospermidine synthase
MREFEYHSRERVLNDDICEGMDELGVLLLGHDFGAWWTGSLLDIHESRKIVPNQNATTVQVAAGVVSALAWTIKNPNKGLCLPDHLDHDFVMELVRPALGKWYSGVR